MSSPDGQMGWRVFSIWATSYHRTLEFLLEHSQSRAPALPSGPAAMSVNISGHQNQGKGKGAVGFRPGRARNAATHHRIIQSQCQEHHVEYHGVERPTNQRSR